MLLLAGACTTTRVSRPVIEETPALPAAGELLGRLAADRRRVRALRTLADSQLDGPDGRFRSSEVLLVEPPARLRIEVVSTFGVTWILATDGETLDVYSRHEETVYRGTPARDLADRYLPVPLPLSDLTELLLGRPPPRAVATVEPVSWEPETGLMRVVLRLQGGGLQTLWFDGGSVLLRRVEERGWGDALRYDLRINGHRQVGSLLVPSDLTILAPSSVQVRLAYANSDVNPDLDPDLFRIPFVVGAREVRLDAGGAPP
jgi:hypothetical protein